MKKILNTIFVLALLLIQVVPAMNVKAVNGTNNNEGTITITGTIEDRTYSIYQVLVLESFDTEKEAYTYKVDPASDWASFINSEGIKDVYVKVEEGTNIITWIADNSLAKEFSEKALAYAKANGIAPTASKTAEGNSVVFENLNLGYYLVDSTLGALCGLTTTQPDATVIEKNEIPGVTKEVKENTTGDFGETNTDYIGKTIYYKTTIDVKAGAENYVLHDVLSDGLTLNQDTIKVYLNGEEVLATYKENEGTEEEVTKTNYTITYKSEENVVNGFVVTFDNSFTAPLTDSDELVVEYNALLNKNAVLAGEGNPNETWLEYGEDNEVVRDETVTYTYSFDLVKTNSNNEVLDGAKFRLYDALTGGNEIPVVLENGVYRLAYEGETGVEIEAGNVTIIGLDKGTFYLGETKAPEGYNKLTSRVEVVIDEENLDATVLENVWSEGGVHVVNLTGAELPSTGGMGTFLFITIGSLMTLGFGVLLVTKLRFSKEA